MQVVMQSLWLRALGLALAGSLWQMALLWLFYWLITRHPQRMQATHRHRLAVLLLLVGTLWFFCSLFRPTEPSAAGTGLLSISWPSGSSGRISVVHQAKQDLEAALPWIALAYLAAVCLLGIRFLTNFRRLYELRTEGLGKLDIRFRLFASEISHRLGIKQPVAVWLSSLVESPMTLGFLRPVILLPIAMINHLSIDQVESILLHELGHIRRNDYGVNLLLSVAGILFFFNPFAQLLLRSVKREREHCCDDLVIQFKYDPASYASALLSLEKTRWQHHGLAMAAAGRSRKLLLERIKRLTGKPADRGTWEPRLGSAALASGLILLVLSLSFPVEKNQAAVDGGTLARSVSLHRLPYQPDRGYSIMENKRISAKSGKARRSNPTPKPQPDALLADNNDLQAEQALTSSTEGQDATESEVRESSIPSTMVTVSVPVAAASNPAFPYVPQASFWFQQSGDSSSAAIGDPEPESYSTRSNLSLVLDVLDAVDWESIQRDIAKSERNLSARQLKNMVQFYGKKLRGTRHSSQTQRPLSDADKHRIIEDISLEYHALQDVQVTRQPTIRLKLQKDLLQNRVLLEENELKRQPLITPKAHSAHLQLKVVSI
jgi:beta-lactamase regulating signal transducer with metallopeptidase domain